MAFEGITIAFRESDEYKYLVNQAKTEFPGLQDYLIDMAIVLDKMKGPSFFKDMRKLEKELKKNKKQEKNESRPQDCIIEGAVQVIDVVSEQS